LLLKEAGSFFRVGLNEGLITMDVAPFGGVKDSGIGCQGGHHGMAEFLHITYVCIGL
jgi:succinate-semialdehyde dehydrogenase/glutarate-semialdehyde dehydrogenase